MPRRRSRAESTPTPESPTLRNTRRRGRANVTNTPPTVGETQDMATLLRDVLMGLMEGQRVRTEGTSNNSCSFKDFLHTKPPEFRGVLDPIAATNWIRNMESIFCACPCNATQKVAYATLMLRDEATYWWESLKATLGATVVNELTWERFKELFNEQYCPRSQMVALEEEFINLQQGNMTVLQYTAKFNERARFVPHLVATEELKARRFVSGLNPTFKAPVSMIDPTTFLEATEAANRAERAYGQKTEEKKKGDETSPIVEKEKRSRGDKDQNEESKACKDCGRSHKGQQCWKEGKRCYKCGRLGHMTKDCRLNERKCYVCQAPDHIATNCPQRAKPIGVVQPNAQIAAPPARAPARAFQLTLEDKKKGVDMTAGIRSFDA